MKRKRCSICGALAKNYVVVIHKNGLCRDCETDSKAPTPEQIVEECRKIREENGASKVRTGLGEPEGAHRSVKVYKTPRF